MKTKKTFIETKDKKLIPVYYTKKKDFYTNTKKKIILVIEEIFGVNDNIKKICKKISKYNYLTISPELLFRSKNTDFNQDINILRKKANDISDDKILNDINTVIKWAIKKFKTEKIGITGFCWGGRITWLYSYHYKNIKSSVVWYGRLTDIKNNKHPIHPLNIGDKIFIPVLGLYGDKDSSIPIKIVHEMQEKIKQNKKNKSKIIIYNNAEHGFFADYRSSYNKEIAKKAFKKMLNWFNKYI